MTPGPGADGGRPAAVPYQTPHRRQCRAGWRGSPPEFEQGLAYLDPGPARQVEREPPERSGRPASWLESVTASVSHRLSGCKAAKSLCRACLSFPLWAYVTGLSGQTLLAPVRDSGIPSEAVGSAMSSGCAAPQPATSATGCASAGASAERGTWEWMPHMADPRFWSLPALRTWFRPNSPRSINDARAYGRRRTCRCCHI